MMNQEDIFRKVGQILNELQEQYEFLARNPAQLNELELELFLANANFLSDHVQILQKINSHKTLKVIPEHTEDRSPVVLVTPVTEVAPISESVPLTEVEQPKETEMSKEKTLEELEAEYAANELAFTEKENIPVDEPADTEKNIEELPEPIKFEFLLSDSLPDDKFEFEEKSIEHIFDRPLSKEEEEIIAQKQKLRAPYQAPPEEIVEEAKVESIPLVSENPENPIVLPESQMILDNPVEKIVSTTEPTQTRPTLNDLLAGKSNFSNSVNEDNNKASITDLKQAINLNEKLLYIKDLFNGYNLAYAEAIELVNKMPDFKTADNFLQNNYAVKNNWSAKQSTVDKFYELLNQRFPAK